MSGANDIANLFAKFGGKPEHYQEIGRADQARDSESRWPLLSSMAAQAAHPPAVQHGQPRASSAPSPFVQPETAPRADGRAEPTLPWGAQLPTLNEVVFSAPIAPAAPPEPAPAAPPPESPPLSQFIPPRPRGFVRPAPASRPVPPAAPSVPAQTAHPAGSAPAFAGFAPAPSQPPSSPPLSGFDAAGVASVATSAAAPSRPTAAPSQPTSAPTALSSLFDRLARPATPEPAPTAPTLSLFERLVRR